MSIKLQGAPWLKAGAHEDMPFLKLGSQYLCVSAPVYKYLFT